MEPSEARAGQSGPHAASPCSLGEAAAALQRRELAQADGLIRAWLTGHPDDPEALRLLAGVADAAGDPAEAERLLREVLERSPDFVPVHADLAALLCRLNRAGEVIALLDAKLARQPRAHWALSLKAAVLGEEGRSEEALRAHEALVAQAPGAAVPWLNYGHALRSAGSADDAILAYRRALSLDPANGFAWRGLADLADLGDDQIEAMERAARRATDDANQIQLHFALGRALGRRGRFEDSFRHYETGNRLRAGATPYDAASLEALVARIEGRFTADFFARRRGLGCAAADPIFIIGMPRSGSTLVEQILACHPLIEGAGELPALPMIAARLGDRPEAWPEAVAALDGDALAALGETYLASTRRYRQAGRPHFTDKLPANWQHVGLIQLILPNARIIDVRRNPLACCASSFATYFNSRTRFPAGLAEIGRYYRLYVRAIAHFDAALPGRIHQLDYERLVDDVEGESRRLLAWLGLEFDPACLRFYENSRMVSTPSAEQVRRPINRDGLERWRSYAPWLGPLKDALGPLAGH